MSRNHFAKLEALMERLFTGPLTPSYLVTASVVGSLGAYLAYSDNGLPNTIRALIMMATLLGLARLFNSRPMRWAWMGLMGLLCIVPLIDLLVLLV